jgi:hypothetical protein
VAIALENAAESNLIGLKPTVDSTVDSTVRRQFEQRRPISYPPWEGTLVLTMSLAPDKEHTQTMSLVERVILCRGRWMQTAMYLALHWRHRPSPRRISVSSLWMSRRTSIAADLPPSESWLGFTNWFSHRTYHASREYVGYIFLNAWYSRVRNNSSNPIFKRTLLKHVFHKSRFYHLSTIPQSLI